MKAFCLRNAILGITMVAVLSALASCGGFSCSDKSKCANDPTPSQADIDECNKILDGKCGSQWHDFDQCAKDNQTCGADGKTEAVFTIDVSDPTNIKYTGKCADTYTKAADCCKTNPSACQSSGS